MSLGRLDSLSSPTKRMIDPPARILKDEDAWRSTIRSAPAFSMRSKDLASGNRGIVKTEFTSGPDISRVAVAHSQTSPPQWTMQSRGGKPVKGLPFPGPGEYELPISTMEKSHPVLPCKSRGYKWGNSERGEAHKSSEDPGPVTYDPTLSCTLRSCPSWTMSGKTSGTVPTPHKDELWGAGPDAANHLEERKLYDIRGGIRKGGALVSPTWTFTGRPESTLVVKSGAPGPGTHQVMTKSMTRMKRSPSWGFGTCSRFGKEPEKRPY